MTTIAAVEHDTGITWCWDSRVTTGNEFAELADSSGKVFRNGNIIFGVCGSLVIASELRYMELPKLKGWDVDRYVAVRLLPAIREALFAANCLDGDGDMVGSGRLILGVEGRAYMVGPDLCWFRKSNGIYIIGSGGDFAQGALAAGASLREAVGIASQHDVYTGETIHVRQSAEILAES